MNFKPEIKKRMRIFAMMNKNPSLLRRAAGRELIHVRKGAKPRRLLLHQTFFCEEFNGAGMHDRIIQSVERGFK